MVDQGAPVILDHDGGVDDLAALGLLAAAPFYCSSETSASLGIDGKVPTLIGTIVVDADCFAESAADCSARVIALARLGLRQRGLESATSSSSSSPIPVAISTLRCAGPDPFPDEWRRDSLHMQRFASLNTPEVVAAVESGDVVRRVPTAGEELLATLVIESPTPVTICVTGPLSNVAYGLTKYGAQFAEKINKVVIMGGAVDVLGNVFRDGRDGTAEWNLYWDPAAANVVASTPHLRPEQRLFFTLDATNDVPVTLDFVRRFGRQAVGGCLEEEDNEPSVSHEPCSLMARFLGNAWAMCTIYERLYGADKGYYAWDALTAAYLLDPRVCGEIETVPMSIDTDAASPQVGRSRREDAQCPASTVARKIDPERFYTLTLQTSRLV